MTRLWTVEGTSDARRVSDQWSGELTEVLFKIRNYYKICKGGTMISLHIFSVQEDGDKHFFGEYKYNKNENIENGTLIRNCKFVKVI